MQVLPAALVPLVPGSIATTAVPAMARRRARRHVHGLINAINILPRTALFDTATFGASYLDAMGEVTQNEAVFKGREQLHRRSTR